MSMQMKSAGVIFISVSDTTSCRGFFLRCGDVIDKLVPYKGINA